jgi:hypothetical protein
MAIFKGKTTNAGKDKAKQELLYIVDVKAN